MVALAFLTGANAADWTLNTAAKSPPAELGEAIRVLLQTNSVQLLDGGQTAYEFWFARELPLTGKPASVAKALDALKPVTLLGAVSIPKSLRDYRDDELRAGVYTVRFALQPQDGNHLGTADYTYFAVLTPAKLDPTPTSLTDYKSLVKASSKDSSADHPVILSLRPAGADDADAPKLCDPAPEHKSVRLKIPARIADKDEKAALTFELVCQGAAKK